VPVPTNMFTAKPPVRLAAPVVEPRAVPTLDAYWTSGYFGNEGPHQYKFFRWGRLVADAPGMKVKRRLIDDDVRSLQVMPTEDVRADGKISTNKKARRLSYELQFTSQDVCQNVLELTDAYIPVSEI